MAGKGVDISLIGDKALIRDFKKLEGVTQRKTFRKAVRESFKPVLRAAKANAPVLTGLMRQKIRLRAIKRSRSRIGVQVLTGRRSDMIPKVLTPSALAKITSRGDVYYPAIVEYGSKKRNIKANPFIRRAFDSNAGIVLGRLRLRLRRLVDDAVARP